MAAGPRCFRCRYDTPSGPVDPVDFVLSITVLVMLGGKGRGGLLRGLILLCVLSISMSVGSSGSRDMDE